MKVIKRIIILGLASILLTGCGSSYRKSQAASVLGKKYHEKFVIDEYRGQQLFEGWYTVIAHSERYLDVKFKADIDTTFPHRVSDKYEINLMAYKFKNEVEEILDVRGDYAIHVFNGAKYTIYEDTELTPQEFAEKQNSIYDYGVYLYVDRDKNSEVDAEYYANVVAEHYPWLKGYVYTNLVSSDLIPWIQDYWTEHDTVYSELKDKMHDHPDWTKDDDIDYLIDHGVVERNQW